ncbi:SDR family oxidoreductase [Rapidithrix thailandica]|uniref:SDR family oxidoreductase n=1 Tax=Rapidithrix thailandica TaxID=413964 RepID=A0AAW9SFI9_9BACT
MNSTILILGATSDMAQACAYRFAKAGCQLILASRKVSRLAPLQSDLEIKHQVKVHLAEFDACAYITHTQFYQSLPSKPDVVILAFGILGEQEIAQKDDFAEAHKIIDANYTGAVSILNIIANDFEQRKSGTILALSSVAGDRGRQSNYIYGSAKAGLTAYLSGLRNRLSKAGVQVITVKPGFVATKMTEGLPLPKPLTAKPEQVANSLFKAVKKKPNTMYVLPVWRYIMLIIRNIPEGIFKKLNL